MDYTNETIAKVFNQYMNAMIIYGYNFEKRGRLIGFDIRYGWQVLDSCNAIAPYRFVRTELVKLLLTPTSKLTDEHAIEVANLYFIWTKTEIENNRRKYIEHIKGTVLTGPFNSAVFEYLIEKGYAVTLRCLDGKTPIEARLAIDKTLNQKEVEDEQ
jgi:hypothetical protein